MFTVASQRFAWVEGMRWPWLWSGGSAPTRCWCRRRNRQRHREHCPSARPRRGLHVSVVFSQNRFGDAQTETGAAPRTLGGVEGIEDVGQDFGRNPGPIVLKNDRYRLFILVYADAQSAAIAYLAHRLLRIQNQIQEHLHQLVRVSTNRR